MGWQPLRGELQGAEALGDDLPAPPQTPPLPGSPGAPDLRGKGSLPCSSALNWQAGPGCGPTPTPRPNLPQRTFEPWQPVPLPPLAQLLWPPLLFRPPPGLREPPPLLLLGTYPPPL